MVLGIFSNCREELAPLQKVEYTFKYQFSYIIAVESMFTGHHYSHWFRPIGCAPPGTVRLERTPCPISHFILSVRDLPSTAVPAAIQFTTLLESCGTSWLQLSSSILTS